MNFFRKRTTKGAISIFLVMILVPTLLLSAVLIDGSRMASARAMTQEAGDLAAASALASYNEDLKDEYGLFAIKDPGKIEEIYKESLKATLYASGLSDDEEYSEKIWGILKSQIGAGNPYKGKKFLNLYDFSVDSCDVEAIHSLANQEVLENQMIEDAKFRGVYIMADRLGLISQLGKAQEEQKAKEEAADAMEKKMEVDDKNKKTDQILKELRDTIETLNNAIKKVDECQERYKSELQAEMERIKSEYEADDEGDQESGSKKKKQSADVSCKASRTALKDALKDVRKTASDVYKKAESAKKEVQNSITKLQQYKDGYNGTSNEDIKELQEEAESGIKEYETTYLPAIEKILDDETLKKLKEDSGLEGRIDKKMTQIDAAIRKYGEENPRQDSDEDDSSSEDDSEDDEEEEVEYYFYYLNSGGMTTSVSEVLSGSSKTRSYDPAIKSETEYFSEKKWNSKKNWENINPTMEMANADQQKKSNATITEDFAKNQSAQSQENVSDENPKARGSVENAVYQALPSKNKSLTDQEKEKTTSFYNQDGNLDGAKNLLKNRDQSMLLKVGEAGRDEILDLSYMFGTFRTRLTGVEKFSKKGMSDADKNSFYMPEWRYAHEDGEQDMRFDAKKNRDSVLRSEVEYLVYGMQSDQKNEDAVYATIYAERLVNNMLAVYRNKEIKAACIEAGAAASLLTAGLVPPTVFKWMFISAWAVAETYVDMNYLINGGYKIPLFKTKDNLILTLDPSEWTEGKDLKSHYQEKGIFVSYEDYLLILLLIQGKEKQILRTADLIEMNMKKTDGNFTMANAYTYLRAESAMSVRYMFGSVTPFQAEYEKNGVMGRMKFKSTIYQGY